MARWEPGARDRLQRAALELFTEHGYPETTAAEIAERAGLAKSTFFRHFADKREVLFDPQQTLITVVTAAVEAAEPAAAPLDAVEAGLRAATELFNPERHGWAAARQLVIDAHPELRERELLKLTHLAEAIETVLRGRGVPDRAAALAAMLGHLAVQRAFPRWTSTGGDWGDTVAAELTALRAGMSGL